MLRIRGLVEYVLTSLCFVVGAASQTLTITTASLPNGVQNVDYVAQLGSNTPLYMAAQGGVGALTWYASGTLPDGFGLSGSSGLLYGRPQATGTYSLTINVHDSASPTPNVATKTYSVTVLSLADGVAALPTDTQDHTIKQALLQWGITTSSAWANAGTTQLTTQSQNLISDIVQHFNNTYAFPSTLDARYFPPLPGVQSPSSIQNPSVSAAVQTLSSFLQKPAPTIFPNDGYPVDTNTQDPNYAAVNALRLLEIRDDAIFCEEELRGFLYPNTSVTGNPRLLTDALTRYENVVNATWTGGGGPSAGVNPADFQDAAELPYMYLMLTQGWPQAVFPSRQAQWQQAIETNTTALLAAKPTSPAEDISQHFTNSPNDIQNDWINQDVRFLAAIAFDDLVNPAGTGVPHTAVIDGGVAEMQVSRFADGGTNYFDQQNEAFSYHYSFTVELERYARVTGDSRAKNLLTQSPDMYTALGLLMPNQNEFITAPSWKKYWDQNTNNASMAAEVGLNNNQYVLWQLNNANSKSTWPGTLASAPFWNSQSGQAIPSQYITYDQNVQGTRSVTPLANGEQFELVSTARPTPVSHRGKSTFVGAVLTNPNYGVDASNFALNAAVETVGTDVLLAPGAEVVTATSSPTPPTSLVNLAQNEYDTSINTVQNATTTTNAFGALSTVHNLSSYQQTLSTTPGAPHWVQTETWFMLPTHAVGLVQIKTTGDQQAAQVNGVVKLVSGRNAVRSSYNAAQNTFSYSLRTWGTQKTVQNPATNVYTYGDMSVQLFYYDYASKAIKLSGTYQDGGTDAQGFNEPYMSTFIELQDAANSSTLHTYPAGFSHYFVVELRPTSVPTLAGHVAGIGSSGPTPFQLSNGVVGFRVVDTSTSPQTKYAILHNPTSASVTVTGTEIPAGTPVWSGTAAYRAPFLDPTVTSDVPYAQPVNGGTVVPPNASTPVGSVTIPPYSHVVFVAQ